jgi:hypothetical protein
MQFRVTFAAVTPRDSIIQAAEKFYDACSNYRGAMCYRGSKKDKRSSRNDLQEYEKSMRPYELIAADWPHYVLPPTNPFTFLGPDMPCRFFQIV